MMHFKKSPLLGLALALLCSAFGTLNMAHAAPKATPAPKMMMKPNMSMKSKMKAKKAMPPRDPKTGRFMKKTPTPAPAKKM